MNEIEQGPALAAEVLNAAWWVRHYPRAHQRELRRAALVKLGLVVRSALDRGDAEPVLYAVAVGLYERSDPRFS